MREKLREKNTNNKARMIAGYCYDWNSDKDKSKMDIILPGGFEAQWNFTTNEFATDPDSFEQVGCIHSIQGWETDYIGVIIGPDLQWDEKENRLCYNPKGNNHNLTAKATEENNRLILNTYRVLLTRGKKGCFVFACDPKVKEYLKKCLEGGC